MAQQQQNQPQQANPNVNPDVNMPKSGAKPVTPEKPATQGIPARQAYRSDAGGLDTSEDEANSEGMAGRAADDLEEDDEKSY